MNVAESIRNRKEQTLYRRKGKKYVPVNDPYAYNGLRNGWWLIRVEDGSTSIRECVYPDRAEIQAAARQMEDKLVDIIRKACEAKPNKIKLNPDEKRDWDWFIKKHGESFSSICYPSFADNAAKIVKELLGEDYL